MKSISTCNTFRTDNYFMYVYVVSVTQEYLVYITKTGLVGLSLNNNTIHDVLPISSKQNVLDVAFDTLNKTMYIVQSPEVGNVSQRQKNCTKSYLIFTIWPTRIHIQVPSWNYCDIYFPVICEGHIHRNWKNKRNEPDAVFWEPPSHCSGLDS